MRSARAGRLAALLALAAAGGAALAARYLDVVQVRGRSMVPALRPGDRLVATRLFRPPRPGEIVLAPDPRAQGRELVKRVVAIGPAGVVIRGDNLAWSTDARAFGPIPATAIGWRVALRYWPMRRAGRVPASDRPDRMAEVDEGGEPACTVPEALIAGPAT